MDMKDAPLPKRKEHPGPLVALVYPNAFPNVDREKLQEHIKECLPCRLFVESECENNPHRDATRDELREIWERRINKETE